ncbi:hypothetical protein Droror1_Dr00015650 [Drosera rotundifolia]
MSTTTTTSSGEQLLVPSKGYALSGKIMLSAIIVLFVVVVVMVCLHLYARWYLLQSRRRRRTIRNRNRNRNRTHLVFYLDSNNNSIAVNRGLDAAIIKSIPTFVYEDKEEEGEEVAECAVCLSEFVEGERGRVLPKCGHSFHVECIDMWFHSHSTCPLCRAPVEAESAVSDDAVVIEIMETELTRPSQMTESVPVSESIRQGEEVTGSDLASEVVAVPVWARRKKGEIVGVSIEVPGRSESLDSDESGSTSQAFRSPIQSLKRILSREKRPLPSPGTGTSCAPTMATVELESGNDRVEV